MSRHRSPVKLTYEDYLYLPDDGKRHEIIDGEHYVSPSPKIRHQSISLRLARFLSSYVEERKLGEVWTAPLDVVFSDTDVVQPDLLFLSSERRHLLTEDNLRGAPDLAVEILSEGTRRKDEITKRHLYERFGVGEYWVIDPELEMVKVYRHREGRFERIGEYSLENNEHFSSPLFPGLEIRLAGIFQKL